ncbi:lysozyme inhibitor LprI family protein [Azospirillum argentinense]|uniref:lysozyme inhibitor LprI family protein n=1 Tax=Azospirillum argentinense TaxID=2970906 RepID=UPI0011AED9A2|nr:lysozyme inhibitor LprI family protein [Azospirillum argentinense]
MPRSSWLCSSWLFGPALSLCLMPFAAMAQTPPDCAKPSSRADRTICASADLKVAAEDVATLLRDTLGNTPVEGRDAIERAQKAFLAERDGACADASAIPACRALYEKRAADLAAQNSSAQKKLSAIVAGIPKDAKAAAAVLQRHNGAPAKAWLVYLYQSGAVAVPDKDATVRRLVDEILNQDLPKDPYLHEEMANLGDVPGAPLGTLLLFLRHVLSTTEMDAPCFLFTKHGQPAFEAFGAFWGNARDETPGLCTPPSSVFDLPEWKTVSAHMDPAIEPALVERGSIRHGYERQFEVDDLQASMVPSTLLESPMSAEARKMAEQRGKAVTAFRSWDDFEVWPEKEYRAALHALPSAITATSKIYREKFKLNPQTADQAAKAAADRFIAGRLGLIMPDD